MSAAFVAVPAALLAAGALYHRVASILDRKRHPPPGQLVDVGGYRLHLHALGEGRPTVILDSALAGTSLSWSEIQPRVAEFTRVVSYDRAGFGWSEPSPSPRTLSCMVDELDALLTAADVEPPYVLVGHSYGGWIVERFASLHPENVAGMVLVDSPHPREWTAPDQGRLSRIARGARRARVAALLSSFGLMRALFLLQHLRFSDEQDRITTLLSRTPPSIRTQLKTFWVQRRTLEALASQIEHAPESASDLGSRRTSLGDVPLTVLTASHPSPERLEDQLATASLSRTGRHVIAERSGHWIPLEEPDLVVEAIRELVERARA